jgi:MFS transporter, FHS family, L-fucose permease
LGKFTKIGGAMLLMAVIGGAILPVIFGRLIDANPLSPQNAILILIPFYALIMAYAIWGFRINSWTKKA